jgi:hypothetical protein
METNPMTKNAPSREPILIEAEVAQRMGPHAEFRGAPHATGVQCEAVTRQQYPFSQVVVRAGDKSPTGDN